MVFRIVVLFNIILEVSYGRNSLHGMRPQRVRGLKARPHAAMRHTCDGVFQRPSNASKSHGINYFFPDFGMSPKFIVRFSNRLQHNDVYLKSFRVICRSYISVSNDHRSDEHHRRNILL